MTSITIDSLQENLRKAADGLRGTTGPGARDIAAEHLEHIRADAESVGFVSVGARLRGAVTGLRGSTNPGARDAVLAELERLIDSLERAKH